jgi:carbamoyltransferase
VSFAINFKDEVKYLVPAVVHFDGTGRVQTVTESSNKWYYNFIKKWENLTKVPIILNTSFNENEPIVNHPIEALNCFHRTEMDILVLENYILTR